jgi:hypothetical protein
MWHNVMKGFLSGEDMDHCYLREPMPKRGFGEGERWDINVSEKR